MRTIREQTDTQIPVEPLNNMRYVHERAHKAAAKRDEDASSSVIGRRSLAATATPVVSEAACILKTIEETRGLGQVDFDWRQCAVRSTTHIHLICLQSASIRVEFCYV